MNTRWAERAYEVVIVAYPKHIRAAYAMDMRTLFRDLLRDPDIGPVDVALRGFRDLWGGMIMHDTLIRRGVLFGCVVLDMWIIGRTLHRVPVVSPFAVFILAGFLGARSTSSFSGGLATAFCTGLVSALTLPGDYLLFGNFPAYDVRSFVFSLAMMVAFCMVPAMCGAAIARFGDIQRRVRRGSIAFAQAWRTAA